MKQNICNSCPKCGGTGIESIVIKVGENDQENEIQCRTCIGSGIVSSQFLSSDLIDMLEDMNDKLNDVIDKCNNIKEKLDEM